MFAGSELAGRHAVIAMGHGKVLYRTDTPLRGPRLQRISLLDSSFPRIVVDELWLFSGTDKGKRERHSRPFHEEAARIGAEGAPDSPSRSGVCLSIQPLQPVLFW